MNEENMLIILEGKIKVIVAPSGIFDEHYSRVIEPEEIQVEIELMREEDTEKANLSEKIYNIRFTEKREAGQTFLIDSFLGFWVTLAYYDKSTGKSKFRLKTANSKLSALIDKKEISLLFDNESIKERMIYEQLYSSARRYLYTCTTDKTYKSVAFGVVSLKDYQLKEKILADFIDGVCFSYRCGLLEKYPVVGKAAIHAYLREYPDTEDLVVKRMIKTLKLADTEKLLDLLVEN